MTTLPDPPPYYVITAEHREQRWTSGPGPGEAHTWNRVYLTRVFQDRRGAVWSDNFGEARRFLKCRHGPLPLGGLVRILNDPADLPPLVRNIEILRVASTMERLP